MNSFALIQNFDRLAEAPNAIPRLRQLIYELAVRGKLVSPIPNGGLVDDLILDLNRGKKKGKKGGLISVTNDPAPGVNAPFTIPSHWSWIPLDQVGSLSGGMTPSKSQSEYWDGGITWFSSKDIKSDELVGSELTISDRAVLETGLRIYEPGCLIMVARSGILKRTFPVSINRVRCTVNQDIKVLQPFIPGSERYLQIVFRGMTPYILSKLVKTGTTVQSLIYEEFQSQVLPIPPLAEQHRIVAKVDELMALCDRLEAAQAERERRRERLNAASLARLNNLRHNCYLFQEHVDFYLAHIKDLVRSEKGVVQLRETIRNLAVLGFLATSLDEDGTGDDLLTCLQSHSLSGKIALKKRVIAGAKVGTQERALPQRWTTTTLGDICSLITSGSRGWAEFYSTSGARFLRAQNIRFGKANLEDLAFVNPPRSAEGSRTQIQKNDLVIVITGAGVTNPALIHRDLGEAYVSQHVGLVRPVAPELSPWFLLCLMAPAGGRAELVERAYGAGKPGLNLENIRSLSIPLPPLAEQRRIVAKVDELMALCDRLEAALQTSQAESRRLLDALLHAVLSEPREPAAA